MFVLVSSNNLELILLRPTIDVRLKPAEAHTMSDVPIVAPQPFTPVEFLDINVPLKDLYS
jgi:hypothetical protein